MIDLLIYQECKRDSQNQNKEQEEWMINPKRYKRSEANYCLGYMSVFGGLQFKF